VVLHRIEDKEKTRGGQRVSPETGKKEAGERNPFGGFPGIRRGKSSNRKKSLGGEVIFKKIDISEPVMNRELVHRKRDEKRPEKNGWSHGGRTPYLARFQC